MPKCWYFVKPLALQANTFWVALKYIFSIYNYIVSQSSKTVPGSASPVMLHLCNDVCFGTCWDPCSYSTSVHILSLFIFITTLTRPLFCCTDKLHYCKNNQDKRRKKTRTAIVHRHIFFIYRNQSLFDTNVQSHKFENWGNVFLFPTENIAISDTDSLMCLTACNLALFKLN